LGVDDYHAARPPAPSLPQRQASHDIATINHFIMLFSEAFKAMSVDLHRNLTQ
jgi:hypothetical protein